jgi:transcriptional regulator with XRE-family HTH domain
METGQYKTPGVMIRETREAKGISLEDLAGETRISIKLLEALEDDNYALLNGPLYVRSFLNSCASTLGMDASLLIKHFELLSQEAEELAAKDEVWQSDETQVHKISAMGGRAKVWPILGALVVVVAVVLFFVMRGGEHDVQPERTQTTEVAAVVEDTTRVETPVATPVDDPPADDPPVEAETTPVETRDADIDAGELFVEPDSRVLTALESLPAGDRSLRFSDDRSWPIVMRLVFSGPTGFAIGVDRDSETSAIDWPASVRRGVPDEGIEPGRIYQVGSRFVSYWGANDHFLLKLDSADGVTVTLNGSPLSIPTRIVGREWVLDGTLVGR